MERKEVEKILRDIDTDPRNGTPEKNRKLLARLLKTANQTKHRGWYPTITQIRMCINCVYRSHGFEGGYCAYTDVTGKENGIRQFGICQVYEMDPKRIEKEMSKEVVIERQKPMVSKRPEQGTTKKRRTPK